MNQLENVLNLNTTLICCGTACGIFMQNSTPENRLIIGAVWLAMAAFVMVVQMLRGGK